MAFPNFRLKEAQEVKHPIECLGLCFSPGSAVAFKHVWLNIFEMMCNALVWNIVAITKNKKTKKPHITTIHCIIEMMQLELNIC